jgi:hypothetical protein
LRSAPEALLGCDRPGGLVDFQVGGAPANGEVVLGNGAWTEPVLLSEDDTTFLLLRLPLWNQAGVLDLAEGLTAVPLRMEQQLARGAGMDKLSMEEIEAEI